MDYHYEYLDDQTFQKLCQAVIVAMHPTAHVQCMPVGQPDGGRDAVRRLEAANRVGFVVYQVKFARDPSTRRARNAVCRLIESEREKVRRLIDQGAEKYVLITNVRGSSALGSGSIDQANKIAKSVGIEAEIWWRDDIDRRLDGPAADVKKSYLEIIKYTDGIAPLGQGQNAARHKQIDRAIRNYMSTQFEVDSSVRFDQVDLKGALIDLFVDLPIGHKHSRPDRLHHRRSLLPDSIHIAQYLDQIPEGHRNSFTMDSDLPTHQGLAAAFLLQMPLTRGVSRLVVEGAPGQGKSTVTQFLCQVNRIRYLDKNADAMDGMHREGILRAPFRADLRDYAEWISGCTATDNPSSSQLIEEMSISLESFLVAQVLKHSGGIRIDERDFFDFLLESHIVIVLDGFDEIADIIMRERIVYEICGAAARFDGNVKSMQLIVTSRPAAFVNSPGFPEDSWLHLELRDLRRENIVAYTRKWIAAQMRAGRFDDDKGKQIFSTLLKKLNQPHLSDLARNPMQLSILLHLIRVKGVALPEKRTMLYEKYMDLFFDREAEKTAIVRNRRDLIFSVHGVLAWKLHTQAESGGPGRITKEELVAEVKKYLESEGHNRNLVDSIFEGATERVGALVSRAEGTFEFDVQPLREYLVARFLYKMAPQSLAAQKRKDTRPKRLAAIGQSPYWANVTRFFCGFYDSGELSGLVDEIEDLSEQKGFDLINHPRALAMMLLSDHVFSEKPRSLKRLLSFVCRGKGFERFVSGTMYEYRMSAQQIRLSTDAGRDEFYDLCVYKLMSDTDPVRQKMLRRVIAANAPRDKTKSLWDERRKVGSIICDPMDEANDFHIVDMVSYGELRHIVSGNNEKMIKWLTIGGKYDRIVDTPELYETAIRMLFSNEIPRAWWRYRGNRRRTALEVVSRILNWLLSGSDLSYVDDANVSLLDIMYEEAGFEWKSSSGMHMKGGVCAAFESYAEGVVDMAQSSASEWQRGARLWINLVDQGLNLNLSSCRNYLLTRVALLASGMFDESGLWGADEFLATEGLVNRLMFAQSQRDDLDWWRARLCAAQGDAAVLCLVMMLSCGTPAVVSGARDILDAKVKNLPGQQLRQTLEMLEAMNPSRNENDRDGLEAFFVDSCDVAPITALVIASTVNRSEVRRELFRKYIVGCDRQEWYLISAAADAELAGAGNGDVDWSHIMHLSRRVRGMGLNSMFRRHRRERLSVPEEVAERILRQSDQHCSQLVVMCERSYTARVIERFEGVLSVSQNDNWFAPFD